MELYPRIGKG
ncbi:unnamed protein product [Cuscuta epithymum]|uniref:Uncharacterized protein n=1 Tax=Cuscuta epithymum TaxID=186058 RepID=A0AAV0FUJ9_9ASTE|nr:unnamed protein product [Cuscuta epithymum]